MEDSEDAHAARHIDRQLESQLDAIRVEEAPEKLLDLARKLQQLLRARAQSR